MQIFYTILIFRFNFLNFRNYIQRYSITVILDINWTLLMSFGPLKILISIHISSMRSACTSEKFNHYFSQCKHYFQVHYIRWQPLPTFIHRHTLQKWLLTVPCTNIHKDILTSYIANLVVEYVSWRNTAAVRPWLRPKSPSCWITFIVRRNIESFASCWICWWTCHVKKGVRQWFYMSIIYLSITQDKILQLLDDQN